MAELHALLDDPIADVGGGAALGHVVLLLRALRPVRGRRPTDSRQTSKHNNNFFYQKEFRVKIFYI